ncbi:MAG: chromate efflux transporter [Sneathiellaceae bacterium]
MQQAAPVGRTDHSPRDGTPGEVFLVFLRLGLTAFGGPVAHLGYFREAFVARRGWLDDRAYADLVALCQFLPGPASSQVGIAIGLSRAGLAGAVAAWLGFTLPSALLLIGFGYGILAAQGTLPAGLLQGLKIVAVAVVAQAVWGMAKSLCPDLPRAGFALVAAIALLLLPLPALQVGVLVLAGLGGLVLLPATADGVHGSFPVPVGRGLAIAALALFALLLVALPLLRLAEPAHWLALVDSFYRSGALVFGGGHVVLPLLEAATVDPGWVGRDTFLAGYGAAQAVPGPLFTFAAYLGTVGGPLPNGWAGGLLCLAAIFAPAFLLVVGVLPFWDSLRRNAAARRALAGVNAAVVGLLLAALYDPVWTAAIAGPQDVALAIAAFGLLVLARLPPWLVVLLGAAGGWGMTAAI